MTQETSKPVKQQQGTHAKDQRSISRRLVKHQSNCLTSREAEVFQLIAHGRADKQIAAELSMRIKTVEKHRQPVTNKLGIHDIAGLTRHPIAKGMITSTNGRKPF
jgi:DNA-binding NarL/FixJ family response regulator